MKTIRIVLEVDYDESQIDLMIANQIATEISQSDAVAGVRVVDEKDPS